MRSLTEHKKDLILKLHLEGYATQDIAERINVNRETVRRYILAFGGYKRDKQKGGGNSKHMLPGINEQAPLPGRVNLTINNKKFT